MVKFLKRRRGRSHRRSVSAYRTPKSNKKHRRQLSSVASSIASAAWDNREHISKAVSDWWHSDDGIVESAGKGSDVAGRISVVKLRMGKAHIPKSIKLNQSTLVYLFDQAFTATINVNQQTYTAFDVCTTSEMTKLYQQAHNQIQATAGGTVSSTFDQAMKVYLHKVTVEYIFSNADIVPQHVRLDEFKWNRDSNNDPSTLITNSPAVDALNILAGNNNNVNQIGFEPWTMCSTLRGICKRTKSRQFMLAPGEVNVHRIHVLYNKFIPAADLVQSNQFLKGFSFGTLFTNHCAMSAGTTSGAATGSGLCRINQYIRYQFRSGQMSRNHWEAQTNTSAFVGTETVVDEGAGDVFAGGLGHTTQTQA